MDLQLQLESEVFPAGVRHITGLLNRSLDALDRLESWPTSSTSKKRAELDAETHSTSEALATPSPTTIGSRRAVSLPLELIDSILRLLQPAELFVALQCSKSMYTAAIRVLYRSITLGRPRTSVQCLRTLSSGSPLPSYQSRPYHQLVRTLRIDWHMGNFSSVKPTRNLYRLLHNAFRRLTSLVSLTIDLPKRDVALWTIQNCSFALTSFNSAFPCDKHLARFLETQPSITELTLRGFDSDNVLFSSVEGINFDAFPKPFPLSPTSLPHLSVFSAVHAGAEVIGTVLNGSRPVKQACVPVYTGGLVNTLNAVAGCKETLERLSITCFDSMMLGRSTRDITSYSPNVLLEEVADRFPDVKALHVVILLATCSKATLEKTTEVMSKFSQLQYVTFMAAVSDDSDIDFACERSIAFAWHDMCPTLRTIILPRGRVWFLEKEREMWECLTDDEADE